MGNELDGNTHALNRHLDEVDKHDAEEARFEAKVAETVAEVVNTGSSGDFELSDILYVIFDADDYGDLEDLLTTFMLSKGDSKSLFMYLMFKIDAEVREGIHAK
jgi:muconolactone delta-isomerase